MNRFRVTLALPPIDPIESGEVVSKKLVRTINGGEPTEDALAVDAVTFVFEGNQDDLVHVELYHIDDAGNESAPSVRDFTLVDNIPPAKPGEMEVTLEELPAA